MDSFYPNFGEVELILVEDNNDFVDPLEANYECEDENEDIKLQLNDNVYEEGDFQMHVDDNSRSSNDEYFHQKQAKSETNGAGRSIKAENHCDSDDSYGVGFIDSSSQNIDSSDSEEFIETKPDVQTLLNNAATKSADSFNQLISTDEDKKQSAIEKTPVAVLSKSTPASSKLSKSELPVEPNYAETKSAESKPAETKPVVTKSALTRSVVKETAGCSAKPSTSKAATNDCEKESKPRKKRRKQIKEEKVETDGSTEKSTRSYSKRNAIPKQVTHNEAYDKKLLFCKICNINFDKSPHFTEHMRSKHAIDKPFECFICSKAYRISSLLAEHIRYHFGEKPYQCSFCDRSFSQLQPYKAHVRKAHTHERPYKCDFVDENNVKCEESFFDTKTYKFHLREHTNDQPFTCAFCSKKFNHSGTYQAHMRIHTNERPYQCVICGKSFAQISTHKAHMLTHSDEYKFPCTECDKKFKQATNLKLHMRVHTKETPYKCEDCGRGFAQLVTYRNHRRIHTGEKPFHCTYDECGKSFRHRNSFRRHLQTHTGEKPFECEICFKRLSQASSYVSHMRRHEKPEKS